MGGKLSQEMGSYQAVSGQSLRYTTTNADVLRSTIDSRSKHHAAFYSGGDVSHQAFIASLSGQKASIEDLLLLIDERAYSVRPPCVSPRGLKA